MQHRSRAGKNTAVTDNTAPQNTAVGTTKEDGSVIPLIAGLCALLLLIGSVTLAITGAHIQTQRLTDFADAQASAVARRLQQEQKTTGVGNSISGDRGYEYAAEYLAVSGADREFDGLRINSVEVTDGDTVRVRLSGRIHPPLVSIVVPDGIEVSAHSSARLNTLQPAYY
ncbi:MAG: hypothetical protein Q3991_08800 [Rothia sp. (in: high G+C Gram-positive bacteria)]|uniref:hypothetical protein n=1 Tax=Rothia sp. (in: high G+C Gram-positive bacteria) TaxID=1885016 RepID=UPI0026DCDC42|nr:hypothetical protein [Rothia sp. (in: high G+C Gram-positive bacteria)]MDO4885031.1 hypothetical protein [Rothia sp. (in: high G+C Gram-positive bacteria)]